MKTALTALCCLQAVNAIILDASCNDYLDEIKPGFTSAFGMAANAATQLQGNLKPPVAAIAGWLFGGTGNWAEAQTRLSNVKNIPATYGTDITDTSNPNDVIVYCNLNRYQTTTRSDGAFYDPNTDTFEMVTNNDFIMCKTGNAIDGQKRPKAITNNYYSLDLRRPPTLTTIDLCNWYLEEVKAAWVTDSDVDSDNGSPIPSFWDRAKNFAQKILQFGKTDMDLAALFDHTLLHEMTHSKAVGIPQSRIPEVESYGWDACLDAKSPTNSESLAFFALGCKLIDDGNTILDNGDVVSASASKLRRRSRRFNS